ncbi:hypothetical protein Tco_1495084, partial [Tanacetum coccineum]
ESSPPPVSVAPMVSPFLCSDDSESDTEMPERHIPTAPILPAPSAIVAPSSEFPLAPVVALTGIRRRRACLIRPGEDIPIGRLYHTHLGGPCRALTARKLVRPLPSHHLALRYTSHHLDCFTSGSSSVTHLQIIHHLGILFRRGLSPLDVCPIIYYVSTDDFRVISCSSSESSAGPSHKRCRSPAATVTSSIHTTRALVPSRADLLLPRKRFRDSISPEDSVEEDIDTDVLKYIETDATAVEVAVDRDVVIRVDVGIDMEVDVGVDVEDEVEDEVESSDRGTMEVGVDVVVGIDISDGMLIPDVVERLEQVEEGLQDIYEHVMEIPLQRIEDIKTGQRELEARSLIAGGERELAYLSRLRPWRRATRDFEAP